MTDGPSQWAERGAEILERVQAEDDPMSLDNAIKLLRRAIESLELNDPRRPSCLSNLSAALQTRFARTGRKGDLNDAIDAIQAALEEGATADPDRILWLSNLAAGLQRRFSETGHAADLDAAIEVGRDAVARAGSAHPNWSALLSNLSGALQTRFHLTGVTADLDEAISAGLEAVSATSSDHPNRPGRLSNLSAAMFSRFEQTGALVHLDEAIKASRDAVFSIAVGHSDRPTMLSNYSNHLRARFRRTGAISDLDQAIAACEEAITVMPSDHFGRSALLLNLSSALRTRFERLGMLPDIDRAIDLGRDAVATTAEGRIDRPMTLSGLSASLRVRFERTGDLSSLNGSITASRDALEAIPKHHPARAQYLTVLATGLRTRFERVGDIADVDGAIAAGRAAVEVTSEGQPNRAMYLSNLGNSLRNRAERTRARPDLDEAIAIGQTAVNTASDGDPDRPIYLSSLCSSLMARYSLTRERRDLDSAISAAQGAVDTTAEDHPSRPMYLSNLAGVLHTRFEASDEIEDLEAAIGADQAAVDTSPLGHPDRTRLLTNLGAGYYARFARLRAQADAEAALRAWQQAVQVQVASPGGRMRAARAWGQVAASLGMWEFAAEGYAAAVELLPLLAWRGIGRPSRERLLEDWAGLAADAAGCAIAAGQADRAIELLEQGRGVLWSQLLELRTDLTLLERVAPDLAGRLDSLRAELDRPAYLSSGDAGLMVEGARESARLLDRRIELAEQWDRLVAQVRALPGFQGFLRSPRIDELRRTADRGPVVVVNISQWRCDALIVDEGVTQVIELRTSHKEASQRAYEYLEALESYESEVVTMTTTQILQKSISSTLEWLWVAVAEPVLARLALDTASIADGAWPRLWWCPTGPLTILPINAAGLPTGGEGKNVLDRVVSSYTPTLRALIRARNADRPTAVQLPGGGRMLVVALRNTPGQVELPNVDRERDLLVRMFSGRYTLCEGPSATFQVVREELKHHSWAHFSCHAGQNLNDPSTGGILLSDGMLAIADLTADRHSGEFVFLSACKTALGGVRVLDEAITLASALQCAGWRHVIATLWSVVDKTAADVAEDLYARLSRDGFRTDRTAEALHHAIRRQRRAAPDEPSRWVPFLHVGP
jgi:tetratricopeptide (TPR) repeat protein